LSVKVPTRLNPSGTGRTVADWPSRLKNISPWSPCTVRVAGATSALMSGMRVKPLMLKPLMAGGMASAKVVALTPSSTNRVSEVLLVRLLS